MGLGLYIAVCGAHLFVNDFRSAIAVRAASGAAAAPLTTLGLFYMIQAWPAAHLLKGLVLGIGLSQAALPLARLLPLELLDGDRWRAANLLELALAIICLSAVTVLRLPPGERIRVFDRLDFVTFALFAPGIALLCAVLGLGRVVWWIESAWLGLALAGSIALLVPALIIEHNRTHPLIDTRWLSSADILRIALSVILVRIALSEQTVGVVGLLGTFGLTNEQLRGLFLVVLLATLAGTFVSAATLDVGHLPRPVAVALALVVIGSLLDARSTSLSRPENFYLSQGLVAFAGALFLAPAMMAGITRALAKGPGYFVSFSVLFGIAQSLGGLGGAALLGTLQTIRQRVHYTHIVENLSLADPQVAERLRLGAGAYARGLADPAARNAAGLSSLNAQATREATVLAYNDVFLTVAGLAALTCVWMLFHYGRVRRRARRAAASAPGTAP